MNELEAARVIYGYANRKNQGNDSARPGESQDSATVVYGTVVFVGDGMTPYTYTAADGTEITTTPALGEYAVLLDSGETVFITSQIPLNVGDRVTLTYSNGMYALTANQSTAAYVQKSAAEVQRETIERITKEGEEIRSETETKVAVVQNSLDDFKKDHQLTDDDITKKVTDTKSETTTEYEAAISAYDKEVTARYQQAISDSESSTKSDYTQAISDATAETDSKVAAAQSAADAASTAAADAQKSADDAADAASGASSEVEKLRTNVHTNYLLKSTYESGIKGLEDNFSESYVSKADQDTLNADFDSRIKANAENISTEVSSRESAIDNLDTKAQGYANDAQTNAEKTAQGYADTAQSNAETSANAYTDGEIAKQNTTIGAIKESQSSLQQESDSIKSDVATKWTTIQQDYATNDTVAKEYATKSELEQTSTGLSLQLEGTVSDVTIEYATGTSSTTAPTTGWSTASPTWSEGKYVWQRTTTYATVTNEDGTTSKKELKQTTTCIQGAKGETGGKGDPGGDGRGVKSIVTQYTRSSSSSSNSVYGGWSSTCPSYYSSYPYYWTRSYITYTDNTTAYAPSTTGTYNGGLTDANRTAASASSTASSASSTASSALSTANSASDNINNFKKQFDFGSDGLTIKTTTGQTVLQTTYDSDGTRSLNNMTGMKSAHAALSIKDWGFYAGNEQGTSGSGDNNAYIWVTEGRQGSKYPESPATVPEIKLLVPNGYIDILPNTPRIDIMAGNIGIHVDVNGLYYVGNDKLWHRCALE